MSSQVVILSEKSKNFDQKATQIRASQIRATEISSNHRELHGAIFLAVKKQNITIPSDSNKTLGLKNGKLSLCGFD